MEIDEIAARVLRRYWPLLLVAVLVPVLVTGAVVNMQEPRYVAVARVDSPNPNADTAGDAGVAITVSQVKAFATSTSLLAEAIRERRVDRTPALMAPQIDVTGLGTSSVVDLRIVDRDAEVARGLTDAVAARVVRQLNRSNNSNLEQQISALDKQIGGLFKRLSAVSKRAQNPRNFDAINEKASLQSRIDGLESDRRELRNQLAGLGVARVVQPAVVERLGDGAAARLVLAGLIGLVAGVLVTIAVEAVRPTVPGPHRVARRLGVPLLGRVDGDETALADLGRRIKLAARRDYVTKVVLVGAGGGPLPAELVSRAAGAVYGDAPRVVTAVSHARTVFPAPEGAAANGSAASARPAGSAGSVLDDEVGPSSAVGGDEDAPAGTADGIDAAGTIDTAGTAGTAGDSLGLRDRMGRRGGPGEDRAPGSGGTRAVAALVDRRSGDPAPASAPTRPRLRVHAFEDIDPGADAEPVGIVAVAGPMTPLAAVWSVYDLAAASGWPLLGVAATVRPLGGRRSGGAGAAGSG